MSLKASLSFKTERYLPQGLAYSRCLMDLVADLACHASVTVSPPPSHHVFDEDLG